MKYLIIITMMLTANPVFACDLGVHSYVRVAAGLTGRLDGKDDFWQGKDDLAAQIEAGIRWPLDQNWILDFKVSHDSQWFRGQPFNDDAESGIEHLNFGIEYRW